MNERHCFKQLDPSHITDLFTQSTMCVALQWIIHCSLNLNGNMEQRGYIYMVTSICLRL